MYKVAFVFGVPQNISMTLNQTIEDINRNNGTIMHIVQSQSQGSSYAIVTITIIYKI